MPSTTPNLSLISWSGSDKFNSTELATNWSILDTAYGDLLKKTGTDTLSGTITVTGSLQFGSTGTIAVNQDTITDSVNYKAIKIAGAFYSNVTNATDTSFGIKLSSDAAADDSFRFKIRGDGRLYLGNGTSQDIVLYRESADTLAVQLGADVDTANPTSIIVSPDKLKRHQGPGLRKLNYIWNPDFESGNAGGWLATAYSTITAAATSITSVNSTGTGALGSKMGEIITPGGSANQGAHFRIYRKFEAGTQYNIKAMIYSGSSTVQVEIGLAGSGVIFASQTANLSSTWTEVSTSWTPISSADEAVFFVRVTGTTAATFAIDEAKVYVGTTPVIETNLFPVAESFPRWNVYNFAIAPSSNTQYVFAIPVEKGMKASRIGVLSGNIEGVGIIGAAAGLYSVATTTDTTEAGRYNATRLAFTNSLFNFLYQGPHAPIVWELDTPYRFTYTGIAYVAMVITAATTMPNLSGASVGSGNVYGIKGYHWYPLIGTLSTGTSLPSSSTIGLTSIGYPYVWIS